LDLPKIKFECDSPIPTSIEPTILPENSQSSQIPSIITDLPVDDTNRERTLSDTSSGTVDYDFDTETCTALASKSVDIDV
jgi:hypothetical protein